MRDGPFGSRFPACASVASASALLVDDQSCPLPWERVRRARFRKNRCMCQSRIRRGSAIRAIHPNPKLLGGRTVTGSSRGFIFRLLSTVMDEAGTQHDVSSPFTPLFTTLAFCSSVFCGMVRPPDPCTHTLSASFQAMVTLH